MSEKHSFFVPEHGVRAWALSFRKEPMFRMVPVPGAWAPSFRKEPMFRMVPGPGAWAPSFKKEPMFRIVPGPARAPSLNGA